MGLNNKAVEVRYLLYNLSAHRDHVIYLYLRKRMNKRTAGHFSNRI